MGSYLRSSLTLARTANSLPVVARVAAQQKDRLEPGSSASMVFHWIQIAEARRRAFVMKALLRAKIRRKANTQSQFGGEIYRGRRPIYFGDARTCSSLSGTEIKEFRTFEAPKGLFLTRIRMTPEASWSVVSFAGNENGCIVKDVRWAPRHSRMALWQSRSWPMQIAARARAISTRPLWRNASLVLRLEELDRI